MNTVGKRSGWIACFVGVVAFGFWSVGAWSTGSPNQARSDVPRLQVDVVNSEVAKKSEQRRRVEAIAKTAIETPFPEPRVSAKGFSPDGGVEEGHGFQLLRASTSLRARTQRMLSSHPRAYRPENVRDLARALHAVEEARSDPDALANMDEWDRDYIKLQNAYFQGVNQLRGVQEPGDLAQQRLDEFDDRSRGLSDRRRRDLKAELLYEKPED